MASDWQIAANRRNAQKSTGPRSVQGKRRASGNAYRHGLAAGSRQPGKNAAAIDALASEIATTATGSVLAALDLEVLQHARTAAEAELDLLRIRAIKAVAMRSLTAAVDAPMSGPLHGNEVRRIGDPLPALSPKCAMSSPPASKPPLQNEPMRDLTVLLKLDRNEQRATARRDRAFLHIVARLMLMTAFERCHWTERTQLNLSITRIFPPHNLGL